MSAVSHLLVVPSAPVDATLILSMAHKPDTSYEWLSTDHDKGTSTYAVVNDREEIDL